MTHASFFSGEGGFDLAAEWMGWENILHCEWNPFCQRILKYYWPNAYSYGNIKETDFTIHRGTIDVLTGGFPCQPYSVAGKRLGKEDDRHLWPEMLRGIREIQPTWVVGENVRGLINWNRGLVFDEVQAELEAIGYEVTPFILPACAVNAPHRRDRVWFVAFNPEFSTNGTNNTGKSSGNGLDMGGDKLAKTGRQQSTNNAEPSDKHGDVAHAKNNRRKRKPWRGRDWSQWRLLSRKLLAGCKSIGGGKITSDTDGIRLWGQSYWPGRSGFIGKASQANSWQDFPTQSPVCGGDDGLPTKLDGITFSKWRNESIKAHGNAVVPQVPYEIFKVIEQMNNGKN